jgi:BlaI family penicillinase repressor
MRRQPPLLAGQELEIMKIVWDLGACTVREVYETLRTRRQLAYTTVMTTMRILERKGQLKVSRKDRAHVYRPARPRQRVLAEMVQEFVDRVFGGAAEPLVQHLVRDRHLTEHDLREIARQLTARKGDGDEP